MADVSHRDSTGSLSFTTDSLTGNGSPEGVVTADIGAVYRRRDGGTNTTFYVKESGTNTNTGWVAFGSSDAAAAARLTIIEANDWVTTARIGAEAVTVAEMQVATESLVGRGGPGTGAAQAVTVSGGLEWVNGDSIQRSALTGAVTASLGSGVTTIAADAVTTAKILNANVTTAKIADANVTNAKLADVATATFKGRTTGGTGVPEDLTAAQALALLADATATTRGIVPTPPNNTTTFLRGDATFAAPTAAVRSMWFWFGAEVVSASTDNRYLNPTGWATTPAPTTVRSYPTVAGNIVRVAYRVATANSTGTVVIKPRIDGAAATDISFSVAAGVTAQTSTITPVAVNADGNLACYINHTGATNLAGCSVGFEVEY